MMSDGCGRCKGTDTREKRKREEKWKIKGYERRGRDDKGTG